MSLDLTQTLFTTSRQSERVQLEGTVSLTTDGSGNGTATVNHNLGTAYQFIVINQRNGSIGDGVFFYASNTANTLTITVLDGTPSISRTIGYKILYSPL